MERKFKNIYEMKQIIKAYSYGTHTVDHNFDIHELVKKYDVASEYKGQYFLKYKMRYLFIAYGLLRNKPYSVIETPREQNRLSESQWKAIHEIMDKFKSMNETTVNVQI